MYVSTHHTQVDTQQICGYKGAQQKLKQKINPQASHRTMTQAQYGFTDKVQKCLLEW